MFPGQCNTEGVNIWMSQVPACLQYVIHLCSDSYVIYTCLYFPCGYSHVFFSCFIVLSITCYHFLLQVFLQALASITMAVFLSQNFQYTTSILLFLKIYCLYWTDGAGIKKKKKQLYTTRSKPMSYLLVRFIFSNNIPQILTTYQAYCPRI